MEVYVVVEAYVTGHGDDDFTVWNVFKNQEKALERKHELIKKHPDSDFDVVPTEFIE